MSKEIVIQNERLKVTVTTKGAEIISVLKDGTEQIWEGNPDIWAGHTPILFPICGGLRDDKFIYRGKEYILEKHGFARHLEFEAENIKKEKAVFLLKSSDETKKSYPFDFEFRVIYTLDGSRIDVEYDVKNLTDGEMYFTTGSHEAYACPEGIENYSILFEKNENLDATVLNGNLLEYKTEHIGNDIRELPLKEKYFEIDALVFQDIKSRKVWLKNNINGAETEVDFDGFGHLLLWQKQGAKYICIEPWCGVPDFVDSDYDITKKKSVIKLEKAKRKVLKHSITF